MPDPGKVRGGDMGKKVRSLWNGVSRVEKRRRGQQAALSIKSLCC